MNVQRRFRDDVRSTQAHWQQLEELTGVAIGDVKTITLGKIFSMELSQYGEDVDEIVVCADSASFLPVSELQDDHTRVYASAETVSLL